MTVKLVATCGACPEQYDAYIGQELVGYLRLRHGVFRVQCPTSGGEEVYRNHPAGDGCFEAEERDMNLTAAANAIKEWHRRRTGKAIPAYEIVPEAAIEGTQEG